MQSECVQPSWFRSAIFGSVRGLSGAQIWWRLTCVVVLISRKIRGKFCHAPLEFARNVRLIRGYECYDDEVMSYHGEEKLTA